MYRFESGMDVVVCLAEVSRRVLCYFLHMLEGRLLEGGRSVKFLCHRVDLVETRGIVPLVAFPYDMNRPFKMNDLF